MRDAHFGFWAHVWPQDVTHAVVTAICQPRERPPLAGGAEIRNPELSEIVHFPMLELVQALALQPAIQ